MDKRRVGLSLSGGGYRATAFHLGTLSKLHELGVLDKIDVISTISGGSITGAAWCLYEGDYPSFHTLMIYRLRTKNVIKAALLHPRSLFVLIICFLVLLGIFILSLTPFSGLTLIILIGLFIALLRYQFNFFPISKIIEKIYDQFFFDGKKLEDLKVHPLLAIGSSNLQTGRPFTFSRNKMADSSYSYRTEFNPSISFKHKTFPVAKAVMASSCVPFVFSPITIDKEFFQDAKDFERINPILIDGGVYDNQGIQKLTQLGSSYECDIIITSDAGGTFLDTKKYPNAISLLKRTVDLFMYRIKTVQMVQHIYQNKRSKPIAYFSLGWQLQNILPGFISNMLAGQVLNEVLDAHGIPEEWRKTPKLYKTDIITHLKERIGYDSIENRNLNEQEWLLAKNTSTNLTCLSKKQIAFLIRHAENLTEVQVKLYCPMILNRPDNSSQNFKQ